MGAIRKSYPRFRREGSPPPIQLTDDDVEIIKTVHRHRFIRAEDLFRLFDKRSSDRLSRRLATLYRAGFLDRPIAQIDRYRQGGSQSMVYGLDNGGARLLRDKFGTQIGFRWRLRNRSYTRENLDHTLAVSRFWVDLHAACKVLPGVSLITTEEILAAAPEVTRHSRHPLSWTVPVQWHGGRADVELTPDAIFGLRVARLDGKTERSYFFVEIDRGTMTIMPSEEVLRSDAFAYRATILRKLYAYADSFALGLHEQRFGIGVPRVLFLTVGKKRCDAIQQTVERQVIVPKRLPIRLMQVFEARDIEMLITNALR